MQAADHGTASTFSRRFAGFSHHVAHAAGRPLTFALSVLAVVVWAATGPYFHYSDTWQLVINTSTTIITFLMVFLIQNTQNRDGAAIQAKLDELIRASAAQNRYIGIEDLSEEELAELRQNCATRAKAGRLSSARHAADAAQHAANRHATAAANKVAGTI